MNTYSSSVHNCQQLETPQMTHSRWVDKHTVMLYYSAVKGEELFIDGTQQLGRISEVLWWVKEASLKGYVLYNPIYVMFWKTKIQQRKTDQ